MRQVFSGWGVALKRKVPYIPSPGIKDHVPSDTDQELTIYFPHPLLHI